MQRVDLPGDQWADVRSVDEVTVRGRNLVANTGALQAEAMVKMVRLIALAENQETAREAGDIALLRAVSEEILESSLTRHEMELAQDYQNATVVAFVAAWSRPEPVTMDSVADLPIPVFDALQAVVGPLALELAGVVPHVTPDDALVPSSPTAPSSGSGPAWRDEKSPSPTTPPLPPQTDESGNSGTNSATGGPSAA